MEEIKDLSKQTDFSNLTYLYMGNNNWKTFMGYKGPLSFYGNIKEGYITLDK